MRFGFPLRQYKTALQTFIKVFATVKKSELRDAIIRHLRDELTRQTNAATMARDEAISEESRAESKWDTHSQEAAYLAEGQARLAVEIGELAGPTGHIIITAIRARKAARRRCARQVSQGIPRLVTADRMRAEPPPLPGC